MKIQILRFFSRVHSQLLLFGLLFGYGIFLTWLGLRPIAIISGAIIIAITFFVWLVVSRLQSTPLAKASSDNLLETEAFSECMHRLDAKVLENNKAHWQTARNQICAIHLIAQQLGQREPTFLPDLIETLHTVFTLANQLVESLQIIQQVRTPHYRKLADQQFTNSRARLKQTHTQLQELHDQLIVSDLQTSSQTVGGIAERLQVLIQENAQSVFESTKL